MWIKIVHWHVWRLAMLFVQSTARWGLLATDCSATSPLLILILILFLSFSDLHRKAAITSYNRRIKHQRVPSHVFLVEPMLHSGSLSSSRGTWVIKQFGRPPCSSITSAWLQISALWSSGPQLLSNYSGSDSSATHPEPYIGKQTHHTQKISERLCRSGICKGERVAGLRPPNTVCILCWVCWVLSNSERTPNPDGHPRGAL